MRALARYLVGYLLDSFRERVSAADFAGEQVRRVLVAAGLDDRSEAAVRRMFPQAQITRLESGWGILAARRQRAQVAAVPMTGGAWGPRLVALLSGAHHKLLLPSPEYIYRLGTRRGWLALVWAVADRFVLAPIALLWLGLITIWLYATGVAGRSKRAEGGGKAPPRPDSDEGARARHELRRAYRRPPTRGPKWVQMGITEFCNYHCVMCPFHTPYVDEERRDLDRSRLAFEMYAALLRDLKEMGTQAVDICGTGEPLTHPQAMEIIALARELGFAVRLATNGSLLTAEKARRLVDLGVERIHVSFNAGTEETYQRVHRGAPANARATIISQLRGMYDYAVEAGKRPVIIEFSAVLTRLNMGEIVQMVEAAHETRAHQFMLILMGPLPATYAPEGRELPPRPEDWPLIRQELARAQARARELGLATNLEELELTGTKEGTRPVYEQVACYIGHEFALILGSGKVRFCCQCSRPMGDLHQDSFARIWYSQAYQKMRELARALPATRRPPETCHCFQDCSHVGVNLDVHALIHGRRELRSKT